MAPSGALQTGDAFMKGTFWTNQDLSRLTALKTADMPWREIAAVFPGRTQAACIIAFYNIRARARRAEIRDGLKPFAGKKPRKRRKVGAAVHLVYAPTPRLAVPEPRTTQVTSFFALQTAAEIRDRIGVLGITGGLLGDPAPGRSALDQKRAGLVDPVKVADRRSSGPKPTLAGEASS
jgi:hypothetical protein